MLLSASVVDSLAKVLQSAYAALLMLLGHCVFVPGLCPSTILVIELVRQLLLVYQQRHTDTITVPMLLGVAKSLVLFHLLQCADLWVSHYSRTGDKTL